MRIFSPLFICVITSAVYVLCLLARNFWVAELITHFYLHISVTCLIFVLFFMYMQDVIYVMWMLMLFCSFAIPTLQTYLPTSEPDGKENAKLTILQFNVLYKNQELAKSIPWIIAQNADIVVLQEINKERAAELGELAKHYKWYQVKINEGREAFGMAIFSNTPVTKFNYVDIGDGWNHYTMTELSVGADMLHLYEVHTPPPMSEYFAQQRNKELELLAKVIEKDPGPHKLLLGDLNTTIYSPFLKSLLRKAELHSAQQDFQIEGSWPSMLPLPLRIGIDHILASKQIKIEKRTVAGYHGSDHLPVITNLALFDEVQ